MDRAPSPPGPATPDERSAVLDLVTRLQSRPDREIVYVGRTRDGIAAELDALSPPWADTVRVVRDPTLGTPVGVVVVEWDPEPDRAWVLGPWVDGDTSDWDAHAAGLLASALDQLPPGMVDAEMCAGVDHVDLARLARDVGWHTGEVNHALVADTSTVAGWEVDEQAVRPATPDDVAAVRVLHDAEFPRTHTTVERLVAGDGTVLVAGVPGAVVGYAAGQVQADGEGYVDYLAVDPAARQSGIGRRLVTALARRVVAASTTGRVSLTVQDGRRPARALYADLGFRPELSFVGHRSVDPG